MPSGWPTSELIATRAANAAFGGKLVTNVQRGLVAEAIVAEALGERWRWCSGDFSAWDFESDDGVRLEIKQAASRQSWHGPADRASRIAFDIRPRKGRYEGATWMAQMGRWADIYIFAHHHIIDDSADHRDPSQWHFYVVRETVLPLQDHLALSRVQSLVDRPCDFANLSAVVAASCRRR